MAYAYRIPYTDYRTAPSEELARSGSIVEIDREGLRGGAY